MAAAHLFRLRVRVFQFFAAKLGGSFSALSGGV